jgi:hypothetical protein
MDHNSTAVHLTRSGCAGSSAVEGTDDVLWNGSEEDGNVRSECEEDEGTNCDDGDSDTEWYRLTEADVLCALSVLNSKT